LNPTLPRYDTLFAVSDLHMGGSTPDFQILHQGPRLGRFIEYLSELRPEQDVALVLNGDIIDSLAEGIDGYIAVDDAEKMMDRIARDASFEGVWTALARFARKAKRHLVFVIGNHDIELGLPHVELWIRRTLAGDDSSANGRITFATRGEGYAALVGAARVFCTHGNEVDEWNIVNHDSLRALAFALNSGGKCPKWEPNAGTRLVIDVMNDIKRRFPFVDLLKPETKAVLPILLVLDPARLKDAIPALPGVTRDLFWGAMKRMGLLSVEAMEETPNRAAGEMALEQLLGSHLREGLGLAGPSGNDVESLFVKVERDINKGKRPLDDLESVSDRETLGVFGYVLDRIRKVPVPEALRRALLDWLGKDDTFDLTKQDETFERVLQQTGSRVDFIVTGHTHLERAIEIGGGNRFYYNCGTWIRLFRFTETLLNDSEEFKTVFDAFQQGGMKSLDRLPIRGSDGGAEPLVLTKSAAVSIVSEEDGRVVGELFHVTDPGGNIELHSVPGSRFERR
jgi:UDP-2,3-diacylglucosamine pyrophosphatase LpxH